MGIFKNFFSVKDHYACTKTNFVCAKEITFTKLDYTVKLLGFADLLVVLKESLGQEPELEDVDLPVGGVQHIKHVPHHLDPPARQLEDLSCGLVVDEEPGEDTTLDANLLTSQPPNLI